MKKYLGLASAIFVAGLFFMKQATEDPMTLELEAAPIQKIMKNKNLKTGKMSQPTNESSAGDSQIQDIVFLKTGWGSGASQLGKTTDKNEPEVMGPQSFVTDSEGNVFVLDQINSRVQVYSAAGEFKNSILIKSKTASDIAIDSDDRIVVLNKYRDAKISIYNQDGSTVNFIDLKSKFPAESIGLITSLSTTPDGIYVELEHEKNYKMDGGKISPMGGRPSPLGNGFVHAQLLPSATEVKINFLSENNAVIWSQVISFTGKIHFITMLDFDQYGNIYLGADLTKVGFVKKLSNSGNLIKTIEVPTSHNEAVYMSRPLRVSPRGDIYQMRAGATGMTFVRIGN